MCVNVIDVLWTQIRAADCRANRRCHRAARQISFPHSERFARRIVAKYFGVDGCPSIACSVQLLHDQCSTTFREDEAIPEKIIGPRGPFRIVIALRKGAQSTECIEDYGEDWRIRAGSDRHLGLPGKNLLGSGIERIYTCAAVRRNGYGGASYVKLDGQIASRRMRWIFQGCPALDYTRPM